MCRLYAMRASEPTRVECSLVKAQNALIAQSKRDEHGFAHAHGWGVADYPEGFPLVEKQTWAAFHGEHFTKNAARIYARTVVAHVRRATVGEISMENTHPFHHGRWIFAHNGTIPNFDKIRFRLLEHMDPLHRAEIRGTTDSEHVFRFLLSLVLQHPEKGLMALVRLGVERIVEWCAEVDPDAPVGLNVILTDGEQMVGSRLNRSLFYLQRDYVFSCPICGKPHVHHEPARDYQSIELASEKITHAENWYEVPNGTVFQVAQDYRLDMEPLYSSV